MTEVGLLPIATEFQTAKRYRRDRYTLGFLTGYWTPLTGLCFDAYEIRHGKTERLPLKSSPAALTSVLPDDGGFQCGCILAVYTHGLFENADVLRAMFGAEVPSLADTFEGLANFIDRYLGAGALSALLRP